MKQNMEEETSIQWEDVRRQMHQAIDERNHVQVQQCLETVTNLKLWLHPITEESALYRAVDKNAFRIYALLHANNCQFKDDEERECIDKGSLNDVQRSEIRGQQEFVRRPKDAHLSHIKNAIRVQSDECKEKIANMIDNLDSDELLSVILKVVAVSPDLKVIVDSDEEDIQTLVGCQTGGKLFGLTRFHEEKIFVGGKRQGTTEKASESEVRGTLLHEMCHLALHLVYNNDGKPYCSPDIERRCCYLEIIEEMKKNSEKLDPIIRSAVEDKRKIEELIVRVPHIIAKHFNSEEGISILQDQAPKLLLLFKDDVIPDMMKYVEDACLGMDAKKIREENARLGKARPTDDLGVIFEKPMRHQDLKDAPLLFLTSPDLRFLEILVHGAVKSAALPYLFFDVTQWDDKLVDVLCENKCNFLLIACNKKEELREILQVLSELSDIVGTKVILLVKEQDKDHFLKEVRKNAFFEKRNLAVYEDSAHLGNVTEECKDTIRKQSCLRFHGTDSNILLQEVADLEAFSTHVDGTTFLALCESKYLDVGPLLDGQRKPVAEYYVKRRIRISVPFDAAKLHEDNRDEVFVFMGCSEDTIEKYLPRNQRIYPCNLIRSILCYLEIWAPKLILCHNFQSYECITSSEPYLKKTIYLLQYFRMEKALDGSSLESPENHFPFREIQIRDEDYLLTPMNDKVVFICGAPGLGKSTLASRLSKQLKERENNIWVMHVSLPERIASINMRAEAEKFQQFAILCGVRTEGPEFFLFQKSLQTGTILEIQIIFDAFDEIDEKWREYILDIVQSLKQTRVSRIYILSRTDLASSIRDTLCVDPIELHLFSDEDLIPFLKGYWKANGATDISDAELHSAATKRVDSYVGAMKGNKEALRIPLLIRMIAESEQESLLDEEAAESIRRCGNLFEIYRRFADCKYNIYAKEKVGADTCSSTIASQRDNEKREKEFYCDLGLLGVSVTLSLTLNDEKILLTAEEKKGLEPYGGLMKDVTEGRVGYGLLDGIVDNRPRFIHRTFAEFFTAHFLCRKLRDVRNHDLMTFVLRLYKRREFNPITYFVDSFAAVSQPLHSTVINGGTPSQVVQDVRALDEFGRTIVHVAVLYADPDVLRKLPMSDAMRCKDVFGMTPLMYVRKLKAWKKLDVFCDVLSNENIERAKEIPEVIETVKKEKLDEGTALYEAVNDNLYSLLKVLLNECFRKRTKWYQLKNPRRVNLDTVTDGMKRTPLFYAKSIGVVKLLLPYCDIRTVDEYGQTLLHNAMSRSYPFEVVEFYFLRLPANVNRRWRCTPLHASIWEGDPDVVKLLLLRSRTDVTYEDGCNAIEKAFEEYNPDIINLVLPNSSVAHRKDVPSVRRSLVHPLRSYKLWWLLDCVPEDEILVSIYHSPMTTRQIRRYPDKEYTYQEQFEAMFPYLNIHDESDFTLRFLQSGFRKEQQRLVPLKQLLLRFDTLFTDEDGWGALNLCAQKGSVDEMKLLLPHSNARTEGVHAVLRSVGCPEEDEMTQAVLWLSIKSEHWR